MTTIGVVGLGTMGAGIAEVAARAGLVVVGVEQDEEWLARGRGHVERSTGRAVTRGKLSTDDQQAILDRITYSTALADLASADFVVEAIPERLDLKIGLFGELDTIVGVDAILATNTSSLSVSAIATETKRPARVAGMHFFNPPPVMRLVEVVRTDASAAVTIDEIVGLARRLGKTPVVIGDAAGFIANRLLFGYLNQAMSIYGSSRASCEDIDAAVTLGAGFPMGPFALLDLIGLDTARLILETIHAETGDDRHAPAQVLGELVAAGSLGRKSGRGFYSYESPPPERQRDMDAALADELLYPYLGDAIAMAESGYATPADIDTAMTLGCGFRQGPFEMIGDLGREAVLDRLAGLPSADR